MPALGLGLGLGLTRRRGGGAAWSPASLPNLAATVLPALSRSSGGLWQDAAKTVPAVADGDPVRAAVCPFSGVEFVAATDATRPLLWEEGGGKWSLWFDGVDDVLFYSVPSWPGTAGSLSGRFRFASTSVNNTCLTTSGGGASNEYYRFVGNGRAYARCFRDVRLDDFATFPNDLAPHTQTWVSGADYRVWVDGTQRAAVAASWQAPDTLRAGRGDSSVFFGGRLSGAILAAAEWSAGDRVSVETYLGGL